MASFFDEFQRPGGGFDERGPGTPPSGPLPPKVFDPNAPAYNPYPPGAVVRQPSGFPILPGTPPTPPARPTAPGGRPTLPPNASLEQRGVPPGTTIPSTPGDPTHGGMFDAAGYYVGAGGAGAGTGGGTGGDASHRLPGESTRDWVIRSATSIGRSDIASNPDYWVNAINSKPQSDDMGYWLGRLKTPDTGGSGESGGAGGMGGGGTLGAFLQPYDKTFSAPVGTDDPGFKFALGEGVGQIERGQAVKGNLLTGGALKDIQAYTTGAALQDYSGAYNRALSTFGTNYDVFRNNQTDPYNKLLGVTQLGYNAATGQNLAGAQYGANLVNTGRDYGSGLTNAGSNFSNLSGSLTGNQGNINASGTIGRLNNYNNALSAFTDWYQHQFPGTA